MEPDQYDLIAAIEHDHWWYRAIRWAVGFLVGGRQRPDGTPLRILDLGAGTGAASSDLEGVVAVDLTERSMAFLRDRPVTAVRADAAMLPLAPETFDVVVAVNLLYSVADPAAVLAEVARVLVPGGAVVLIEPAFPSFERAHDRRVQGRRRFRRPYLDRALERAGLEVRRSTYLFSFGAPLAAAQGLAYRLLPSVGEVPPSIHRWPLNLVLDLLAAAERAVLRRVELPVGTSVVMFAERGSGPTRAKAASDGRAAATACKTAGMLPVLGRH